MKKFIIALLLLLFTWVTAEAIDYTISGVPLNLIQTAPESGDVTANITNIPGGTTTAEIVLTIYDPDFADEGRLFINGNGPIILFGAEGVGSNDSLSVTLNPISTPISWYQIGDNTLTFWHDSTAGYNVENVVINFAGGVPDTPSSIRMLEGETI
jgi:hypothetical protein